MMSRIEKSLIQLETRLRQLVEGETIESGIPRKLRQELQRCLVSAMHSGVVHHQDESNPERTIGIAPNHYTLILPVDDAQALLSNPALLDRLVEKLEMAAKKAKVNFTEHPVLQVVADPRVKGVKILAEFSPHAGDKPSTTQMEAEQSNPEAQIKGVRPDAFLIVNGLTTYPLTKAVINIGSSPKNQVVLTDPEISSEHAQLRANNSHFTIFDLGSRGGTFVNGVVVSSQILTPGDVIKVGGQLLVFGQESLPPAGYTQKVEAAPLPPEIL